MANLKQKLFVIILASLAVVGSGELDLDEDVKGPYPCMQKMEPCGEQSGNQTNDPALDSCCKPLRAMLFGDDKKCICNALRDPMVLTKMNVTQEKTMAIVYVCGGQHKSLCDDIKDAKDNASPSPQSPPSSPSSPPSPPPAQNAASRFRKSSFAASSFIAALIFSAAF